jgi:hypothetical protein
VSSIAETWRRRLGGLSWFMRCLNEPIARRANAEDGRTGRFWEGRFKSQALLDESALITALAYVDLNPIAGTANHQRSTTPFNLQDYLQLVDWTDRLVRSDKHRSIDSPLYKWLPTVAQRQVRYEWRWVRRRK